MKEFMKDIKAEWNHISFPKRKETFVTPLYIFAATAVLGAFIFLTDTALKLLASLIFTA